MAAVTLPSSMRAWQYTAVKGGIEKNMRINASASIPKTTPDQHLVQVISAGLNPVDYKVMEVPLIHTLVGPKLATPATDFVGKIVKPAQGSSLPSGQIIFGTAGTVPIAGGAFAQYAICKKTAAAVVPQGIDLTAAAASPIAGLTAYQGIVPYVKGDKTSVFINGGSGGVGSFAVQIAKAMGCYVATTCSTANVDLCKSLGADLVIDYRTQNVLDALVAGGRKYDHVYDTVGSDTMLYYKAHLYTAPSAAYVYIAGNLSWGDFFELVKMFLLPGFLGGGKRKLSFLGVDVNTSDLEHLAQLIQDGRVKPLIDSEFSFEDAPKAIEKSKTGRAKGKIVVHVTPPETTS